MSIQNLILGSLVSKGANRLLSPGDKTNKYIDDVTGGGFSGKGTSGKSKGKSTLGGIAKQGILGLIARSILGPILGPLALTLGQNFLGKNPNMTKGLGFFNQDGIPKGPPGIPKGPFINPDTPIDEGFQVTGNYAGNDFYSAEGTTVDSVTGDLTNADGTYGGNINDEFAQPTPTAPSTPDLRDRGGSDSDGGGGGGGQSDSQAGADAAQEDASAGAGGYAYGGRASYSGGGLASLYR